MVISFSPLELGLSSSFKSLATRSGPLPYTEDYVLKKAKISLFPKRDHMIRQANRLGLRLRQLTSDQLTELYYNLYNPSLETVRDKSKED